MARYVCRLLKYLDAHGYQSVTPDAPAFPANERSPLIDLESGYVSRGAAQLPRQGPEAPWRLHQNYLRDVGTMRRGSLTDGVRFGRAGDAIDVPGTEQTVTAR